MAEGGSLQLRCEVQHCGLAGWTGGWVFQKLDRIEFTSLIPSERIEMPSSSSTANSTDLFLHIHNINQSDAGAYKCSISWPQNITSSGHVTYVNVTAGTYACCWFEMISMFGLIIYTKHIVKMRKYLFLFLASSSRLTGQKPLS